MILSTQTIWNKILVIGAGGTGSYLLSPLARFLQSINFYGELIIADGDSYDDKNKDRQNFSLNFVTRNKAEYQGHLIQNQLGNTNFDISIIDDYLSREDLDDLCINGTIVINCTDNKAIRKYAEEMILSLENGAHICCGNELRSGQVQLSQVRNGTVVNRSIFESSPSFNSEDGDRSKMTCQEIAELPSGGQIIGANFMAAAIALNFIIQLLGNNPLHQKGEYIPFGFTYFDILTNSFLTKDPSNKQLSLT